MSKANKNRYGNPMCRYGDCRRSVFKKGLCKTHHANNQKDGPGSRKRYEKPQEECGQCGFKTNTDTMQVCLRSEGLFCSDACHQLYHDRGGK